MIQQYSDQDICLNKMPIRYINMTGRVNDSNTVRLPNDFTQTTKDKYIIIKKVRLINNNGQLDMAEKFCIKILRQIFLRRSC